MPNLWNPTTWPGRLLAAEAGRQLSAAEHALVQMQREAGNRAVASILEPSLQRWGFGLGVAAAGTCT